MPYGEAGIVELRGQSGLILELQKDGPKVIQWAPDDKRALEVELRMHIVDWERTIAFPQPPLVRWKFTYGHGVQTWNVPIALPPSLASTAVNYEQALLPQRGIVVRHSVRELKIEPRALARWDIDAPGSGPTLPAPAYTKVQISLEPVYSEDQQPPNRQEFVYGNPAGTSQFHTFPAEANEFRVFNLIGRPFALGVSTFRFTDLGGTAISAAVDSSLYGTFTPIPPGAAQWIATIVAPALAQSIGVEYRR